MGYTYKVELVPTAVAAAKTLVQIVAGAAPIEIVSVTVNQSTLTAVSFWNIQLLRKSAAATVTPYTPILYNPADPASLAIGGAALTGVFASAEGTNGDIGYQTQWNVLNGEWLYVPVPKALILVPQSGIFAVKLNTSPSTSSTVGCTVVYHEYR